MRRLRTGGDMDVQQCTSCNQYWANNSGPRHTFELVTRVCPDCVGRRLPVVDKVVLHNQPALAVSA